MTDGMLLLYFQLKPIVTWKRYCYDRSFDLLLYVTYVLIVTLKFVHI